MKKISAEDEERIKAMDKEIKSLVKVEKKSSPTLWHYYEWSVKNIGRYEELIYQMLDIHPGYTIKKGKQSIDPLELLAGVCENRNEKKAKVHEFEELVSTFNPEKDTKENPDKVKKLYNLYSYIKKEFSNYPFKEQDKIDVLSARLLLAFYEKENELTKSHIAKNICQEFGKGNKISIQIGEEEIKIDCALLHKGMTYTKEITHIKRGAGVIEESHSPKDKIAKFREEERKSDPTR